MSELPTTDVVDIEMLLKIIAFLVTGIVALIIYTWSRFEKKQDQLISGLAMFTEEFVAIKKDTEYLKKDIGEIKIDLHEVKKKINLV